MEPLSGIVIAGLWMLTAAGAVGNLGVASGLEAQAQHYEQQAGKLVGDYRAEVERDLADKIIDRPVYINELERAGQLRRALLDHADLARRMAADRRGDAARGVLIDLTLSLNPAAGAGGLIGPSLRAGGKVVDVSLTAISTHSTLTTLGALPGGGDAPADSLARTWRSIELQSQDELLRARLGHRLTWTIAQWRELNERYPDDPKALQREFDQVLDFAAKRVKSYSPELIGQNSRFADIGALRDYLADAAEDAQPAASLFPDVEEQPQQQAQQPKTPCPELSRRCRSLFMRGQLELNKAELVEYAECAELRERRKACLAQRRRAGTP